MEVLQRTANRGSISTATDTGYNIGNSLKLESDNSEYLHRTPSSAGSATTWTASMWVKRTELGSDQLGIGARESGSITDFWRFTSADKIRFHVYSYSPALQIYYADTDAVFRDTSAWYHVVLTLDSTNADGSERLKLFVNGIEQTANWQGSASESVRFRENGQSSFLGQYKMQIGRGTYGADHYFNGYIAEVNVLDGIAAAPTAFGEYDSDSGIWIPKEYEGSYGTNGFYLDFADSGNLGDDESGNGNDFTEVNIAAADQATDTPTNLFCTFNPTFSWIYSGTDASATILNGAATADNISGTIWKGAVGTMAVNKGKWYWEWENNAGAFGHRTHGILTTEYAVRSTYQADDYSNQLYLRDGATPTVRTLIDGTAATPYTMTTWTSNNADVFGIALNMDDEEATFYRNGTAITINGTSNTTIDISSVDGVSKYVYPLYSCYGSTEAHYNFGGFTAMGIASAASDANGYGTFEYAPPSGYYALCTKNLAEYG